MSPHKIIDTLVHRASEVSEPSTLCSRINRLLVVQLILCHPVIQIHIIFLTIIIHEGTETARKESRSAGRNRDCAFLACRAKGTAFEFTEIDPTHCEPGVLTAVKRSLLNCSSDLIDADDDEWGGLCR